MKILRTYILKDFISNFFFSFLMLTVIISGGNFIRIIDMIIRKGMNIVDATKLVLIFLPFTLRFTIPLSFLLGILLTVGRLISDNELIAINVAGISSFKVLNIFLVLGIISSLLLFILNDKFIPNLQHQYRKIIKGVYTKNISSLIEPGVFLENFGNYIIYISDKDNYNLKNIFIYETNPDASVTKLTFAKRGRFVVEKNVLKMELEDGFRDETKPIDKKELYRINFRKFFLEIPIEEKKQEMSKQKPSDMSLEELKLRINYLKKKGIDPLNLVIELHQRINYSFSVIAFVLLGFGVATAIKHKEKSINFGVAFLAAGIYYLLLILGQALAQHKLITPFLGCWLANITLSFIGIYLIYKNVHYR